MNCRHKIGRKPNAKTADLQTCQHNRLTYFVLDDLDPAREPHGSVADTLTFCIRVEEIELSAIVSFAIASARVDAIIHIKPPSATATAKKKLRLPQQRDNLSRNSGEDFGDSHKGAEVVPNNTRPTSRLQPVMQKQH